MSHASPTSLAQAETAPRGGLGRPDFSDLARLQDTLLGASAQQILGWAAQQWGDRLVVANSFGAEDVVLVDMAAQLGLSLRFFTLDTGRLPQETYDVMDALQTRYGVRFEVHLPDPTALAALLAEKGPNSFYRSVDDRRTCCHIRKVEPLQRALADADAWVTGLRRSQSVTRGQLDVVEVDFAHQGRAKVNPLADWSQDDVWDYIRAHNVPYNALHDRHYPSIGCAPCTRAVAPGEDLRAGRWWWETPDQKECGLHK